MFGVIFVVFGLGIYLLINRGSSGDGGVVYQSAGTDPNKLAAETQLAVASIQANSANQQAQFQLAGLAQQGQNDLALATLQTQLASVQLGSEERLGVLSLNAQIEQMRLDAVTTRNLQADNLNFQLQYQRSQNELTTTLSGQQMQAFQLSSLLALVPTLRRRDRDDALLAIAGLNYGRPVSVRGSNGLLGGQSVNIGNGSNPQAPLALPTPSSAPAISITTPLPSI